MVHMYNGPRNSSPLRWHVLALQDALQQLEQREADEAREKELKKREAEAALKVRGHTLKLAAAISCLLFVCVPAIYRGLLALVCCSCAVFDRPLSCTFFSQKAV